MRSYPELYGSADHRSYRGQRLSYTMPIATRPIAPHDDFMLYGSSFAEVQRVWVCHRTKHKGPFLPASSLLSGFSTHDIFSGQGSHLSRTATRINAKTIFRSSWKRSKSPNMGWLCTLGPAEPHGTIGRSSLVHFRLSNI